MDKQQVHEMPDFEYTPQGFKQLAKELKAGKVVKNPFAKFYGEKIEVEVVSDK